MWDRFLIKLTAFCFVCAFAAACEKTPPDRDFRPSAVTPSGVIAKAVEEIGGEFIILHKISQENATNKIFPVAEKEIVYLTNANVIFFNGLYAEERLKLVTQTSKTNQWKLNPININSALDEGKLIKSEVGYNPHFWQDVTLWRQAVSFITDNLVQISPENERIYRKNEEQLLIKLTNLDKFIANEAQKIPEEKRILVTQTDTFEYFGARYGFQTAYMQTFFPGIAPTMGDFERLCDFIKTNNIRIIFAEEDASGENLNTLINKLKNDGYHVKIGGTLLSLNADNKNYLEIMTQNIQTITNSLMGDSQ